MVTDLRGLLIERGAEPDRVHVELFPGFQKAKVADDLAPATVAVRLKGRQREVSLAAGDTVLDSALRARLEAPYARRQAHPLTVNEFSQIISIRRSKTARVNSSELTAATTDLPTRSGRSTTGSRCGQPRQ